MARYISGILLAIAVVALLGWAPIWACEAVVLVVVILASHEYVTLCIKQATITEKIMSILFCGLIGFVITGGAFILAVLLLVTAIFCFFILQLFSKHDLRDMFLRIVFLTFGVVYIAIPLASVGVIILTSTRVVIFWLLAVTFLGDTVAFLFGKLIGGKKMAPSISPGKTWSGFMGSLVGGFVGSVATMLVAAKIMGGETDYLYYLACGGAGSVVAIFGVLGDLFESMIKRALGVKDSGALIPGHGGILDRIDGLLFTAPVVLLLMSLLQSISKQGF